MVKAVLSAGSGSLETNGEYEREYAFRRDFIQRKGSPKNMVLMRVHGDSISGVGRARFRQVELADKILAKHAALFSPAEARVLRRNARRGACQAMWRAAERLHAAGAHGAAAALGARAIGLDWRQTSRKSAGLLCRALLAGGRRLLRGAAGAANSQP